MFNEINIKFQSFNNNVMNLYLLFDSLTLIISHKM